MNQPTTAIDHRRERRERDLDDMLRGVISDAISRGVLDREPIIPLNYRRVICLPDGSRIDVQIARLTACEICGKIHGRDSSGCRTLDPRDP